MSYKIMSAEEAASLFFNGANVGFSGFTAAGTPKVVPSAIAAMAEKLHNEGKEFKINVFTGASSGDMLDGALVRANAINFRAPYQSNKDLRNGINTGAVKYSDMHLSHLSQELRYGFYGKLDFAVVEAADVTPDGEILPSAGVGLAPTACMLADKIIIELNSTQPKELYGMHDIFIPANPPYRKELPIYKVSDRAGDKTINVDPKKIVAIVESNEFTNVAKFTEVDATTAKIGQNVANFLAGELKRGTVPPEFLPIQSGVGNVANAVLYSLGDNKDVPTFTMYTEVIQDAVIDLMEKGRISFASGCSLTTSTDVTKDIYSNLKFFNDKVLLRPIEISNNPEIIRRLGLITINTALEADIFGNVNSTHVLGTKMMNGIGGSGDFTRNAYISIFTCPSIQKGGLISPIVPMVSHCDHSEHSVKILITEQGIADLRGLTPIERAKTIIENCVHPDYKQLMWDYLKLGGSTHTPLSLKNAFAFHTAFAEKGDMTLAQYI